MDIKQNKIKWTVSVLGLGLILGIVAIGWYQARPVKVSNYLECIRAGYPVSGETQNLCTANHKTYVKAAIAETAGSSATSISFEQLVNADSKNTAPRSERIITNQSDWQKYWNIINAGITPSPPLLPVDFSKQVVAAVNQGPQPTSGYAFNIVAVETMSSSTVVTVHEVVPGARCNYPKATSNPYHIVVFDRVSTPITFSDNKISRDCDGAK